MGREEKKINFENKRNDGEVIKRSKKIENKKNKNVSSNILMHKRNRLCSHIDFLDLSQNYNELKPFIISKDNKTFFDFNKKGSSFALTRVLFDRHYSISWDIPEDNLCPMLPGRLDYVQELADELLNIFFAGRNDSIEKENEILKNLNASVLDIGCGSSCVYGLLIAKEFEWKVVGTEIDSESIVNAKKMVSINKLNDLIEIREQKNPDKIFSDVISDSEIFCLSMCNPPFYDEDDSCPKHPTRNRSGILSEVGVQGGEISFIQKIIDESITQNCCVIYSSLVAKKESLKTIEAILRLKRAPYQRSATLCQGNQARWVVFWSWLSEEKRKDVLKKILEAKKSASRKDLINFSDERE